MRSRQTADDHRAEVTRRRLELLSAEIAGARSDLPTPRTERQDAGPGDLVISVRAESPGRHARRSVGLSGLVSGWLHDRLPATMQGRVRLGAGHVAVLALTIAAGVGATAWWVVRADDPGALVPTASPATSSSAFVTLPAPLATVASTSTAAPAIVVVDVAGRVRRPGIATLPAGSRVVDALKAAGGVQRGVDPATVNLARLLVDGEQIVVGSPPPAAGVAAGSPPPTGGVSTLVSLNTADQTTLESLPGVGPVTAQAIIAWREENGGFHAVDELLEVSGIGDATLARLAPHVTL